MGFYVGETETVNDKNYISNDTKDKVKDKSVDIKKKIIDKVVEKSKRALINHFGCEVYWSTNRNTIMYRTFVDKFVKRYNKNIKDNSHYIENISSLPELKMALRAVGKKNNFYNPCGYILKNGDYLLKFDSHTFGILKVSTESTMDMKSNISEMVKYTDIPIVYFKITFIGKHYKKYLKDFYKLISNINRDKISVNTFNNGYIRTDFVSVNSLNNIISDQKKLICDHIDKFIENRPIYESHNIIYKTGIMMYGKPGTGKTSICKAIAAKYNMDLYIVKSINELNCYEFKDVLYRKSLSNDTLIIILFEELDVMINAVKGERDDSEKCIINNISNLLQFLDGVNSPTNTIFIATTNNIDLIPDNILRDGRFDLKIEMKEFDERLAIEYCKTWDVNPDIILKDITYPITPATLQKIILNYKTGKEDIIQEV